MITLVRDSFLLELFSGKKLSPEWISPALVGYRGFGMDITCSGRVEAPEWISPALVG